MIIMPAICVAWGYCCVDRYTAARGKRRQRVAQRGAHGKRATPPLAARTGTGQTAELGGVREGGLVDDEEQREADGDGKANLNAREDGAEEGRHPHQEVEEVGLEQEDALLDLEEAKARGHHDCTHRIVRDVLEHGRQEEQHEHDHQAWRQGQDGGGEPCTRVAR